MKRAALPLALALLAAAPSAEAGGHSCHEDAVVRVLGRRRCGSFGRWDVTPRLASLSPALSLEADWHRLLVAPRTFDATLTVKGKVTSFEMAGSKLGLAHTDLVAGRVSSKYGQIGPVRLGWAGELGASNATSPTFVVSNQSFHVQGTSYGSLGLNAAVGLPLGRFLFRGELFAGLRKIFHFDTVPRPARRRTGTGSTASTFASRRAPRARFGSTITCRRGSPERWTWPTGTTSSSGPWCGSTSSSGGITIRGCEAAAPGAGARRR